MVDNKSQHSSDVSTNNTNIIARKREIRSLIARAEFEKAFKRLIDFSDDFTKESSLRDKVVSICYEFNSLAKDGVSLPSMTSENKKRRNQIISHALLIMDKISEG